MISANQVRQIIILRMLKGASQNEVARQLGVSGAYLSLVMQGKRDPGDKICDALGLERVVGYRNKPYRTDGDAK